MESEWELPAKGGGTHMKKRIATGNDDFENMRINGAFYDIIEQAIKMISISRRLTL